MWQLLNTDSSLISPINALVADVPKPAGPYKYTSPNISSYAVTSTTVANLGFEALLKVNTEGEVFYYVIDVAAYTNDVSVTSSPDSKPLLVRNGIGFRVALAAWHLNAGASSNVGLVAASCQVDRGQSSLLVKIFAGDVAKLDKIAEVTRFNGDAFNATTLKNLAGFVSDLSLILVQDGSNIPPVPVKAGALDPNGYSPQRAVAANHYAIEQLKQGRPASQLDAWVREHKEWRDYLSPVIVRTAFANLGVQGFNSGGTQETKELAQKIQGLGT